VLLALLAPLADIQGAAPTCEAEHCFEIQLHVAGDDKGLAAEPAWIAAQIAAANHHFKPLDVGFQLASVDALPESAMHVEGRDDRDALASHVRGSAIHVFIVGQLDDVDSPGATIYGVTWRRQTRRYVIVSAQAWERTLAHELGHFFGLPHSHVVNDLMSYDRTGEPFVSDAQGVSVRDRARRFLRSRELRAATPTS